MGNKLGTTIPQFLDGGSASAAAIAAFDWSTTPLGPIDAWPVSLKTAVAMMIASLFPKAIFWGPDYTMLHNDAFRVIMGTKPIGIGYSMREVWAEVWDEIRPIAERAMRGEATFIEDFPLVIKRSAHPEQCYFTFCYSPVRDENGRVAGFIDTVIETTGKVLAEESLRTQNAELAHRIQNTLAIVSSIARQTLRATDSTEDAWEVLKNRFGALAETHNVLRASPQTGAEVGDVVRATLRAYADDVARFDLSGPAVLVPERQALALSLAINELATNALKYGALSVETGRVAIGWTVEQAGDDTHLLFRWHERGGPPVTAPKRQSFGTRLIEHIVPNDFGGTATLSYAPDGLVYELDSSMHWFGTTRPPA